MGADFIRKAAKTFTKSWDRHRLDLATPTLFTTEPSCVASTVAADIVDGVTLREKERLTVQTLNGQLVALRGLSTVAVINKPSAEIAAALDAACGIAQGTVEHVHTLSGVADISLC
jgi:hypothetical protein